MHPTQVIPLLLNDTVHEKITHMLAAGIISSTVFARIFPTFVVTKRNGKLGICFVVTSRDGKRRIFVDKCHLLKRIKTDQISVSKIGEILENSNGCSFLTTLNLFFGYRQIPPSKNCKDMTTFTCKFGIYAFEVCLSD